MPLLTRSRGRQRFFNQPFSPSQLFRGGIQGAWYDPSDNATMFQDAGGLTPVTAVEQPVGLILDKSGRGNHAFQSTAASRPVLRARYNLLTYSEQFDNAAWFKEGGAVSANSTLSPDGTTTADTWTASATNDRHAMLGGSGSGFPSVANADYVFSAYVKKGTHNYVSLLVTNNLTTWFVATFDLSGATPVMSQSGAGAGGTFVSSSVESAANGFWRLSIRGRKTDAVVVPEIALSPSATPTYGNYGETTWAAAGTETIVIWGAQLLTAADATATGNAYQRIVDAATYATGGVFQPYLAFDGVDDALATNAVDFTATDKMSVFAGANKTSDAAFGVVAELSATIATNNGSFLLSAPNSAAANYNFSAGGTARVDNVASTYAAPITNVITGLANIATPSNQVRINGASIATVTTTQGTGTFGNYPMYFGRRNNATDPFNGRIYGLIVRGAASSTVEVAQTESWLNAKTGAY